ncbi:MAG: helix-turn-helix domain-containing protein [Micropepsaceae bacterium]
MKVSRARQAENREKIVESASRLFREKGFEAVTIADIMGDAGLTHGGFYGHFPSKTALMAEALALGPAALQGDLKDVAKAYLTPAHRDSVGRGCPYAALGGEAARLPAEDRAGVTARLRARIDALAGEDDPAKRRWAIAGWSAMVGALLLSRISADPALSDEILAETRRAFGAA